MGVPDRPGSPDAGAGCPGPRVVVPEHWRFGGGGLALDRPRVMGVLNLTPDSFSDGGQLQDVGAALARARALVADGAELIDVGGESTRPGAAPVPAREELRRVLPFLREAVPALGVPLSIDTRKAEVAGAALEVGVRIVNDVSGLAYDPALASVVAESRAGVVLMHMRGEPATMVARAVYRDLVGEVRGELEACVERARAAGIADERIVVDPGLGFAKTAEQSLALLGRLRELRALGFPLLIGPSRKRFLGHVLGVPPSERVNGTAAACVLAYLEGARIFRVHDPGPAAQALAVAHAVATAASEGVEEAGSPRSARSAAAGR